MCALSYFIIVDDQVIKIFLYSNSFRKFDNMTSGLVNPDLAKERHANLDLSKLTKFLGETQFKQPGEYENMLDRRDCF